MLANRDQAAQRIGGGACLELVSFNLYLAHIDNWPNNWAAFAAVADGAGTFQNLLQNRLTGTWPRNIARQFLRVRRQ